jgi:hypothetical protein
MVLIAVTFILLVEYAYCLVKICKSYLTKNSNLKTILLLLILAAIFNVTWMTTDYMMD